jgi:hypothetical protein
MCAWKATLTRSGLDRLPLEQPSLTDPRYLLWKGSRNTVALVSLEWKYRLLREFGIDDLLGQTLCAIADFDYLTYICLHCGGHVREGSVEGVEINGP